MTALIFVTGPHKSARYFCVLLFFYIAADAGRWSIEDGSDGVLTSEARRCQSPGIRATNAVQPYKRTELQSRRRDSTAACDLEAA